MSIPTTSARPSLGRLSVCAKDYIDQRKWWDLGRKLRRIRSSSPTVPRMRRWCVVLAPSQAPRRWPRWKAPGAPRLRANLANLSVGLFLNSSDVILKMPFDLSHAHTFPATEGDNVGGGLKVLLDQDHRFDEISTAGHRCLLLDFDHLILVWR